MTLVDGPREILRQALDVAISAWLRDLASAHGAGLQGVAAAIAQRVADAQTIRDTLSD